LADDDLPDLGAHAREVVTEALGFLARVRRRRTWLILMRVHEKRWSMAFHGDFGDPEEAAALAARLRLLRANFPVVPPTEGGAPVLGWASPWFALARGDRRACRRRGFGAQWWCLSALPVGNHHLLLRLSSAPMVAVDSARSRRRSRTSVAAQARARVDLHAPQRDVERQQGRARANQEPVEHRREVRCGCGRRRERLAVSLPWSRRPPVRATMRSSTSGLARNRRYSAEYGRPSAIGALAPRLSPEPPAAETPPVASGADEREVGAVAPARPA